MSRADVRTEVGAGRWTERGTHTVQVGTGPMGSRALWFHAVWESGAGAVLDGVSALLAAGLTGFDHDRIDVAIPAANRWHRVEGVKPHRRRDLGPATRAGIPRARPETAALRAAMWAATDRTAALILCLAVQQRIVSTHRLWEAWSQVRRSPRRAFLHTILRDLCHGAESLGELDFARMCRERGLPPPTRQSVRTLPGGRVYLDVEWEDLGLVVEIDGAHHLAAFAPVQDALRQNEVTLGASTVLRIPVIGLRVAPEAFLDQVVRAHHTLSQPAA